MADKYFVQETTDMIKHKDFAVKFKLGEWNTPEYEPLEETLLRLNGWIEENESTVMNVETILLPNIYFKDEQTMSKGAYSISEIVRWFQVFRVWYQA